MGSPESRPVRIGNEERERAVRALGNHFAAGRLDPNEFDDRCALAYAARTTTDLDALFADLPNPAALVPPPMPVPPPMAPMSLLPMHPRIGLDPAAPYGREPMSGMPYSERHKVVAGVLQLVLPFGIGRFYTGHIGIGIAQLVLSVFGVGILWAWIDGIVILAGRPTDPRGFPLRS